MMRTIQLTRLAWTGRRRNDAAFPALSALFLMSLLLARAVQASCPPGVAAEVVYQPVSLFGGVGAGLAIDANDNLYVAENTGVFVTRVTPGGAASTFVPPGVLCSITDMEFDLNGNLLIADGVGNGATGNPRCNRVLSVAPNGTVSTFIASVDNPGGIGVNSAGHVFVSSWDLGIVTEFDPNGVPLGVVGSGFNALPMDVEVDSADNIYVAAFHTATFMGGTRIYQITPGGTQTVFADPGIIDPHSLAFAADGTLWATYYNSLRLFQFDTNGNVLQNLPGAGPLGADADNGIAINSDGDIHVLVNGGRTTPRPAVVKLCGLAAPPAGPTAVCRDITVQLDAAGNASITPAEVDGGSHGSAAIVMQSVSPSSFTCANVGPNTVTLTVEDVNGNTSTCTATVTVVDSVAPAALCQDVTIQLDSAGNGTVTAAAVNAGSSDACGIATLSVSPNTFTCGNVGANGVTLTVVDNNGNTSTCAATVTVEDNVAPVASCQDLTVQLDATGNATITAAQVNAGSSDACGIATMSVSPSTFTCADVGPNTVTLTVVDNNGNTSTCAATVTVEDNVAPVASCQDLTVQLDATGNATITAAQVNAGSSDACGIATMSVSPRAFTCADVGPNTVTLTVVDNNGNTSTCTATVMVEDNVAPVASCQDVTIQLDAAGNGTIIAAQVDAGSNDACGIATLSVSPNTFTCADVGPNTVTLTVVDNNGNMSTCAATVTVEDNVAPIAQCQDVTVQLDAAGNGAITAAMVDAGSNDACGIAMVSVSPDTFTCADVGANAVMLTVVDNNGNMSTCAATVTVEDNVAPVALCQDVTIQLDAAGNGAITTGDVNAGSDDACGIAMLSVSPNTFTCDDLGVNPVMLTVVDVNGNMSDCTADVLVEDIETPLAVGILASLPSVPPTSARSAGPPDTPRSACAPPNVRRFVVYCEEDDNCEVVDVMADLVVMQHAVDDLGECVEVVTIVPVACEEIIELRLAAPPCPARSPRSAADPIQVTSEGMLIVTAESVILEVTTIDQSGNASSSFFDPTVDPSLPCLPEDLLDDGTCCPSIARPPAERCRIPACGEPNPINPRAPAEFQSMQ